MAATTQPNVPAQHAVTRTFKADVALTRGVIVVAGATAGESVKLPAAADEGAIIGVVKDDIASGEYGEVYVGGIVPCLANAAITSGDPVAIGASTGRAKTAAPASGANSYLAGFALDTASGAGVWFPLQIALSVMQGA